MTETNNRYISPMSIRRVPTRRMSFAASLDAMPKHFAGEEHVVMAHAWAGMSATFPDGEDFFVRSVRHFRDQLTDPELKRQVAGFIGQEAMHGREHRELNARLDELGYPVAIVERFTKKGLAIRERLFPAKANLAATVALEHVTATLAEIVMTDAETQRSLGDGVVRDIYFWHALEESEHKAVAFDVYRAIGGSERLRIWTMRIMRHLMLLGIGFQVLVSVLRDRDGRRSLRRSWRAARRTQLLSGETWRRLKEFERPGFHPDDRDTSALLDQWRELLFGADGTLTSNLLGATA
jgi:predicted metal-dependent hydrolase